MSEDKKIIKGTTFEKNNNSNVIFIDPNQDKGEVDLFNSPEDLSISIELDVEIPGRTSQHTNEKYNLSWKSKDTTSPKNKNNETSFLRGDILGGKNVLTDFYTDINFDSSNFIGSDEAIGISSIDISYDSWILPQITIKFIDVRGGALFNSAQYQQENSDYKPSNNIFRAFFTFPYPLFKLQVKGFYGRAVTYELILIDFRGNFNSQTGNFEVTAKFLGNTYAFFADIRYNLLKSAPYNKSYGKNYWEDNIKNRRFYTNDGYPMPTLKNLNNSIKSISGEVSRLISTDEDIIKYTLIQKTQHKLNNILSLWSTYVILLEDMVINLNNKSFNHSINLKIIRFINGSDTFNSDINDIKNAKDELINSINNFNSEYKLENLKIPFPNKGLDQTFNIKIEKIDINQENTYKEPFNDDYIKNNINLINSDNKFLYIIDYNDFINTINNYSLNNKNNYDERRNFIGEKVKSFVQETISFKPSIKNITKIIFAHLETFMATYYSCLDNINNSNRMVSEFFPDIKDTDVNGLNGDKINLPPFPYPTQKGEEIWIGDLNSNINNLKLEEVKYVESIFDAISQSDIVEVNTNLINKNIKEYWYPIHPYDTYLTNKKHSNNPYHTIKNESFYNLTYQIGIRMFSSLSQYTDGYFYKDLEKRCQLIAKAEAYNIYKGIGEGNNLLNNFNKVGIDKTIINYYLGVYNLDDINNGKPLQLPDGTSKNTSNNPTTLMVSLKNEDLGSINYNYSFIGDGAVLPLYTSSIDDYSKDWYCGTKLKYDFNEYIPFIGCYNNFNEGYLSSNNEYNSFIFNINDNLFEYEKLKENIETGSNAIIDLTENWNLNVDNSILFIGDGKSFIRTPSFDINNERDSGITYLPKINNNDNRKINLSEKHELYSSAKEEVNLKEIIKNLKVNNNKIVVPFIGHKHFFKNKQEVNVDGTINAFFDEAIGAIKGVLGMDNDSSDISLFGSKLYYTQNDYKNKKRLENIETEVDYAVRVKCSKALLFLSTLPWDKIVVNNYFKNFKYANIQRFPKSVLLKLGAMVWRHKFKIEHDQIDPIYFHETLYEIPECNTYIDDFIVCYGHNKKYNNITEDFDSIFKVKNKSKDIESFKLSKTFINKIVSYFLNWVDNEFNNFADALELKGNGGKENLKLSNFIELSNKIITNLNSNELTINKLNEIVGIQAFNNYSRIYWGYNNSIYLINREDCDITNEISDLLKNDVCLISTTYNIINNNHKFKIKQKLVESYLTTLVNEINRLNIKNKNNLNLEEKSSLIFSNNRVMKMELYRSLKNLYDKWCGGKNFNYFKLEECYEPNFKFIDKFYNDIGDSLIINFDTFNEITFNGDNSGEDISTGVSLYSILSGIITRHNMLFIPTSTNIKWLQTEDDFKKVFKPLPYFEKDNINNYSGFTSIYIGKPSTMLDVNSNKYGYADDGLYFKPEPNFITGKPGVETYPLPCFAISYAKQNQSYFKNIELTMNNPVDTEQSIQAVEKLINSGTGTQRISQGQDMYNIYTQNSYQATVEMMGCVQIQPMMYFQLFNIPMFKGAYMIYKVNHNITPGNMTTTFTGMRMSKTVPTLETEPFAYKSFLGDIDEQDMWMESVGIDTSKDFKIIDSSIMKTVKNELNIVTYGSDDNIKIKDNFLIDYMLEKDRRISKHLKLSDCVTGSYSNKNKMTKNSWDEAGKLMPLQICSNLETLCSQVDKIIDWVNLNYKGEYSVNVGSVWRVQGYPTKNGISTYHGIGSAADLHIINKSGNIANPQIFNECRKWISLNLPYNQLAIEQKAPKVNSMWLHYAFNPLVGITKPKWIPTTNDGSDDCVYCVSNKSKYTIEECIKNLKGIEI